MDSTNICEILKACKDCGVVNFELGELKVQFGGGGQQPQELQHIDRYTEEVHNEVEEVRFPNLGETIYDLALTDPEEYERLVEQGLDEEAKCN